MQEFMVGIVLYNPEIERLKENIDSICKQVKQVILIDNASDNIEEIKILCSVYKNTKIIENVKNTGIAFALNEIMNYGLKKGYKWVLTLDQDSICPNNIISEYSKYIEIDDVAIISPTVIDRNRNKSKNISSKLYEEINLCITSGALTNTEVWNKIGRFDEVMFIDGVDNEYCIRLLKNNYHILQILRVELLHEIGHIAIRKFFFWNVVVRNHNSFRKYYISKNVIYVAKKHFYYRKIVIAYLRVFKIVIVTLLYESDKIAKVKSIFKGMRDGKRAKIVK